MIEKWKKVTDPSTGKFKYEKIVVGASSADEIIVKNPNIAPQGATLNHVLGAMKKNIDCLFGNVRFLGMHGGGGTSTGSGTIVSDKPAFKMLDSNGFEIISGSTSINDSSTFTFTIEIDNPRDNVNYSIVVTGGTTTKYLTLSETTVSSQITISGLSNGGNEISVTCLSTSNGSYEPQKVHFYKQIASFTIGIQDNEENNISGTVTKQPGDDFTLNFIFTPTVEGEVKYKIDYSELTTAAYQNDTGGIRQGSVTSSSPVETTIDFADIGSIPVGTTASIIVSGSLTVGNSTITASPVVLNIGYTAGNGFLVTSMSKEWNNSDTSVFSQYYFSNGNNPQFDLYIQGQTSDYNALYAVYKSYYMDASGKWIPFINAGSLEGWTYDNTSGKSICSDLTSWQNNNISVYLGDNAARYVEKNIYFIYTQIPSDGFIDSSMPDGTTAQAAHLKLDIYVINTKGNIIKGPLMTATDTYKPDLSMKTLVAYSQNSVPDYVKGSTYKISDDSSIYKEYGRLYFNFDTIKNTIANTNTDSYSYQKDSDSTPVSMEFQNTNNILTGIVMDSSIQTLRFSGGSYAEISLESLQKANFISASSDPKYQYDWVHGFTELETGQGYNADNGICIEIVYKSDQHTDNTGTILSMADYDNGGNITLGINVSLEKAKMVFQGTGTASIDFVTSQDTFTQLDFVLHKDTSSNIIGKIYKNGICQRLTSVTAPDTADAVNLIDVYKGIFIGGKMLSTGITECTDVDIYGFRLYKGNLTDYDIMKNWLISYSSYNKIWNPDSARMEYDYENVINPILRKNFFNSSSWRTDLWDYVSMKQAAGTKLYEAFTSISGSEKRQLPVMLISLSDSNTYGYDYVHGLYDETQADENNNDLTKRMDATLTYYDVTGNAIVCSGKFNIQGTSTQEYFQKNYEIYYGSGSNFGSYSSGGSGNCPSDITENDTSNGNQILFTPKAQSWLPENEYTLKADVMDSAHANNAAIGKWINGLWSPDTGRTDHYFPLTPPQADTTYEYHDKVKATLEGFPILLFVQWGSNKDASIAKNAPELLEFQGIYSFNLGRASHFNLGFKRFQKYELMINRSDSSSDDISTWTDAATVMSDSPSLVNRYRIEPIDSKIFSFESTTNEPTDATGMQQFDLGILKNIWSIKYAPGINANEEATAYGYLQNCVRYISFLNKDDVQDYWYQYDADANNGSAITQDLIYVMADSSIAAAMPLVFFRKEVNIISQNTGTASNPIWTYTHQVTADDVSLMGNTLLSSSYIGQTFSVKSQYMSWEQGLFLYSNSTNDTTWNAYHADFDNIRPDLDKEINISGDNYSAFVNKFCIDAGPTDNLISGDPDTVSGRLFPYLTFSRYFLITILFGMIDSLGKNLTLRTWNLNSTTLTGLLFPAFYDMDTDLGLSNFGNEDVNAMAFVDYWMNVLNSDNESQIKVLTEHYPEKQPVKSGNAIIGYNYVDTATNETLAYFDVNSAMPPDPDSVMYDMPNSHLWHVIRFLPYLVTSKYVYDGDTYWAPALEWSRLRSLYFTSVDEFITNYFQKQNAAVGEFVYDFDYAKKYQHLYTVSSGGTTSYAYSDMHFCHGTRVEYVRQWLKKRVNFLDAVFNYKGLNTVDSNENYDNTMNSQIAPALPSTVLNADVDSVYTTTNQSGVRLAAKHKVSTQTVYSTVPTILRINIGSITSKRYLLLPYTPTSITINIDIEKDATWVVSGFSKIYQWDNLSDFNFITFDCTDWSLKNFDFSGLNSLTEVDNYKLLTDAYNFDVDSTPTNINDFTSMPKLESINLSNTDITNFTVDSGNLKTLNLTNTAITVISLDSLVNLQELDITNCQQLKSVSITNCPNFNNLTFSGNKSLVSVTISNCKKLSSFTFDAKTITSYTDATSGNVLDNSDKITGISITGQNDALQAVSISNINNPACTINLSGCTSLCNLTLSSNTFDENLYLPATIDTGTDSNPTEFNIYDSSFRAANPFSVTLYKSDIKAFTFGKTAQSYIIYGYDGNTLTYHAFDASSATVPDNAILNLSVFKNVSSASFTSCPNISYIALPWTSQPYSIDNNITVDRCSSLKRIFGNLSYSHACFKNRNDANFSIENWSRTTDSSVKTAFENILSEDSSYSITAITGLTGNDNDPSLQDICPKTRIIQEDSTDFAYTFANTGISGNDFYYIMAQLNLLNKAKDASSGIHSLSNCFAQCSDMFITDLSHLTFKYIAKSLTAVSDSEDDSSAAYGLKNMFQSDPVTGLIYSPDTTKLTTGDNIGTLTPFALSPLMMFADTGWNLNLSDNSVFYYNDGSVWGFQQQNINDVFNSKIPVMSSQWNRPNNTQSGAYFYSSYILKNFPNATTVNNSFNGIAVYPQNVMGSKSGREYTMLFDNASNLTSIIDSFDFVFSGTNQYYIDIFGGDSSMDASFPTQITKIENSFNLSPYQQSVISDSSLVADQMEVPGFFFLTDNMFSNFKDKIKIILPVDENSIVDAITGNVTGTTPDVTVSANGAFLGDSTAKNIVKAYCSYSKDRRFPYSLQNCTALQYAQGFYRNLDLGLSIWIDPSNGGVPVSQLIFSGSSPRFDFSSTAGWSLDSSIIIPQDILENDSSLINASSIFRNIIGSSASSAWGIKARGVYVINKDMPVYLPHKVFGDCISLTNIAYGFADNHYITGQIPSDLLYVNTNPQKISNISHLFDSMDTLGFLYYNSYYMAQGTDSSNLIKEHIMQTWHDPQDSLYTFPNTVSEDIFYDSSDQDGTGIYLEYSSNEFSGYDKFENANASFIRELKRDNGYICDPSIFDYASPAATIDYIFANTQWQSPRSGQSQFVQLKKDSSQYFINDASLDTYLGIYIDGNPFSGIRGRVHPRLLSHFTSTVSFDGLFMNSCNISPYSYSSGAGSSLIPGKLMDPSTFWNNGNMASVNYLWSNNIVPRNIIMDPSTFWNNGNLTSADFLYRGSLWFGYDTSNDTSMQIGNGLFDNNSLLKSANGMFTNNMNATSASGIASSKISDQQGSVFELGVRGIPGRLFTKASKGKDSFSLAGAFAFDRCLDSVLDVSTLFSFVPDGSIVRYSNKITDSSGTETIDPNIMTLTQFRDKAMTKLSSVLNQAYYYTDNPNIGFTDSCIGDQEENLYALDPKSAAILKLNKGQSAKENGYDVSSYISDIFRFGNTVWN